MWRVSHPSYTLGFDMDLKKYTQHKDTTFKWITIGLFFTIIFNLQGLHEWAQRKANSKPLLKLEQLTETLDHFGQITYLNSPRDWIRDTFLQLKKSEPSIDLVKSDTSLIEDSNSNMPKDTSDEKSIPLRSPSNQNILETKQISTSSNHTAILPHRVLLIGDSILKSGLQLHLQSQLKSKNKDYLVEINSKSGTGLSRPEVYNWISYTQSLAKPEDSTPKYDVTFIFLGTNDAQNFIVDNTLYPFGSTSWSEIYSARVENLIQATCKVSDHVYWVSSLKMRSKDFDRKLKFLHSLAKERIQSLSSCAEYMDVSEWFTLKSNFVDQWAYEKKSGESKPVKIRTEDGIHLSYWGAQLFSKKLLQTVVF